MKRIDNNNYRPPAGPHRAEPIDQPPAVCGRCQTLAYLSGAEHRTASKQEPSSDATEGESERGEKKRRRRRREMESYSESKPALYDLPADGDGDAEHEKSIGERGARRLAALAPA